MRALFSVGYAPPGRGLLCARRNGWLCPAREGDYQLKSKVCGAQPPGQQQELCAPLPARPW
eukprot:4301191-Lingulodinium_polyedra.AAC.1